MFKVWYRDFFVWTHYKGASLVANLGEPLLYLFAFGFGLGRLITATIGGKTYSEFIAPALIMVSVMNTASFETTFSSYTRLATQKTFEAIAVTPISFRDIILGEILWATTKGCFSALIMLAVFAVAGLVHHPLAVLSLVLCFIAGVLFSSLGMIMTALAKNYEFFSYYFTLFISPMFLFSGTFFPLGEIGVWAKALSWILPLTHAVQATRELFDGRLSWMFLGNVVWLIVAGAIATWFAVKKMEKRLVV